MTPPPFQTLLDAHGREVHRFLRASVGPSDADDVYQETWLAALRAYPRLRDHANLRAWVFTVAHRKAIDHHRARARRPLAAGEATITAAAGATDPPALPAEGHGPWAVAAGLPDKQRTALALRYLADLAYAEIGAAMEITPEAARRNVHEALKRLREEYDPT